MTYKLPASAERFFILSGVMLVAGTVANAALLFCSGEADGNNIPKLLAGGGYVGGLVLGWLAYLSATRCSDGGVPSKGSIATGFLSPSAFLMGFGAQCYAIGRSAFNKTFVASLAILGALTILSLATLVAACFFKCCKPRRAPIPEGARGDGQLTEVLVSPSTYTPALGA